MNTINVNLSPHNVREIRDGLLVLAREYDRNAEISAPLGRARKEWLKTAARLRSWANQLNRAANDDQLNPHVPVVLS